MPDKNICPFVSPKKRMGDNEYFEALTGEVFQVIIGVRPVIARWSHIKHAFEGFSVEKVARFGEDDVERLMLDLSMIRNRKKIWATIRNAREFLKIKQEYGSFEKYLKSFGGDIESLVADLDKRMHYVGAYSIRKFLGCLSGKAA